MKELIARNQSMKIILRYLNGDQYYKITPKSIAPMVTHQLKQSFTANELKVEESESGWLKVTKGEDTSKFEKAHEKLKEKGAEDLMTEDEFLEKQAEAMRSQGFIVAIKEIGGNH